jgi:hypothetical protein
MRSEKRTARSEKTLNEKVTLMNSDICANCGRPITIHIDGPSRDPWIGSYPDRCDGFGSLYYQHGLPIQPRRGSLCQDCKECHDFMGFPRYDSFRGHR